MSKRIQLVCLTLGCLLAGWLFVQITTGQALGQAPNNISSGTSAGKYDLRSSFIGDTWETWKFDRSTGEAWHEADNKLVKIKDPTAVPAGDYDVALVTNGKVYLTYRIERKSGRLWKINGAEWMELKPGT